MKNSHLAIGIAGSIVIGTIIGMLFAPDKGSNTRKKIIQKGNSLKNNLQNGMDNLASSIENDYEKRGSKIENAVEDKMLGNNKPIIK